MAKKVYQRITTFPSKSKPGKVYTVKMDEEGNLSCNCPAWIYPKKGRARDCYHVRVVRSEMRNPVSLYQSFHGVAPVRKRPVYYEEPKGEIIKIGRLARIEYEPEPPSKHTGIRYTHEAGDLGHKIIKSNAILATNKQGTQLYIVRDKKKKYPIFNRRGIIG